MTLTLQKIKDCRPDEGEWNKLAKSVGSNLSTELSIGDVLISNGLGHALWCLRCLEPRQRVSAIMPFVRRASAHTNDKRVHDCIAEVDKWLAGDDSVDLEKAVRAADTAAWAADAAAPTMAARAAQAAVVSRVAEAAWWAAAEAARAARATAWAAAEVGAAEDAEAALAASVGAAGAERKQQQDDLLDMFPPLILKG